MTPTHIEVDTFLRELGDNHSGQSSPVVIVGSDFRTYILKTQDTPQGTWNEMFFHELLVAHIAEYLGILTPECGIATVDTRFLEANPVLRFHDRFKPGTFFASLYLSDAENNLKNGYVQLAQAGKAYISRSWNSFFDGVANPETAAKIIVLDILTANFDRFGNYGNLLIAPYKGKRSIYAIDHGHCFFGPQWDSNKATVLRQPQLSDAYVQWFVSKLVQANVHWNSEGMLSGLGLVFRAMDRYIDVSDEANHSFLKVVDKLSMLDEKHIDEWFVTIPDEWFVDKKVQTAFYKHFLLTQKKVVPMILNALARHGAFSNHLGGVLQWNVKPTGTP